LLTSLARAALWRLLGDGEQSLAAAQCAAQAAQASGVPQFLQNAQLEMLLTQSLFGELPDPAALQALSEAAQTAGEVPQQARAALALAALLHRQGQPAEALSTCQRALTLARSCPDQPLIGESLLLLLRLHEALGQREQAQACRAELLALAQTAYAPLALPLEADSALRPVIRAACGASL
jgi:tetratricopeptide (TPR) repeat protein